MKKENMNNKGFSLVELIIVIAIMAVLVVVLAPQYLKYVERSRNSTDLQNATAVVTACQVYAADPEVESAKAFKADKTFTIEVTNEKTKIDGDNKDAAIAALQDAGIITGVDSESETTELKCKSKTKWKTFTMKGSVDTNGGLTFTYTSDPKDAFQNAMNGDTATSNSESK